jgi:hypothetical protein
MERKQPQGHLHPFTMACWFLASSGHSPSHYGGLNMGYKYICPCYDRFTRMMW